MITRRDIEQVAVDANRYLNEMKREALTTLVPAPEEKESRIDLITLLRGRRPNLYRLFLADVEQAGWLALSNRQMPDMEKLNAIEFIRSHATSLDGKRSNQVVEIAKTESQPISRSILDVLKGKK